jgi:hypothetical protein
VHQSGELETLLENNGVIPKIEVAAEEDQSSPQVKDTAAA